MARRDLTDVVADLRRRAPEATPRELAELLWLSAQFGPAPTRDVNPPAPVEVPSAPPVVAPPDAPVRGACLSADGAETGSPAAPTPDSPPADARRLRSHLARPPALESTLLWWRALHRLGLRGDVGPLEVDRPATVQRTAQTDELQLVLRRCEQTVAWLLIVEDSAGQLAPWQPAIAALARLARRSGRFVRVRHVRVDLADMDAAKLVGSNAAALDRTLAASGQPGQPLRVLVVSDGLAPGLASGALTRALARLPAAAAVAWLHPWGEARWAATPLLASVARGRPRLLQPGDLRPLRPALAPWSPAGLASLAAWFAGRTAQDVLGIYLQPSSPRSPRPATEPGRVDWEARGTRLARTLEAGTQQLLALSAGVPGGVDLDLLWAFARDSLTTVSIERYHLAEALASGMLERDCSRPGLVVRFREDNAPQAPARAAALHWLDREQAARLIAFLVERLGNEQADLLGIPYTLLLHLARGAAAPPVEGVRLNPGQRRALRSVVDLARIKLSPALRATLAEMDAPTTLVSTTAVDGATDVLRARVAAERPAIERTVRAVLTRVTLTVDTAARPVVELAVVAFTLEIGKIHSGDVTTVDFHGTAELHGTVERFEDGPSERPVPRYFRAIFRLAWSTCVAAAFVGGDCELDLTELAVRVAPWHFVEADLEFVVPLPAATSPPGRIFLAFDEGPVCHAAAEALRGRLTALGYEVAVSVPTSANRLDDVALARADFYLCVLGSDPSAVGLRDPGLIDALLAAALRWPCSFVPVCVASRPAAVESPFPWVLRHYRFPDDLDTLFYTLASGPDETRTGAREGLVHLLSTLFSPREATMFVHQEIMQSHARWLSGSLPREQPGAEQSYHRRLVATLDRHGYIEEPLFARLREVADRRAADIAIIHGRWKPFLGGPHLHIPTTAEELTAEELTVGFQVCLAELLANLFNPEELDAFLYFAPNRADVSSELAWNSDAPVLFRQTAAAYMRKQLIDDSLFERLREMRPQRGPDINALEKLWGSIGTVIRHRPAERGVLGYARQRLVGLLLIMFSPADFRAAVGLLTADAVYVASAVDFDATMLVQAVAFVRTLERRELITAAFFAELGQLSVRHQGDVRKIAALWVHPTS